MSIATEIQRIQTAKDNIKAAIENKGVTVGSGTIDTYAEKISEISTGGGDYDQGYEDSKNSVGNLLEYATALTKTFYDAIFPDGYELTLDLPNTTNLENSFQNASGMEKVIIKGNINNNPINMYGAFRNCRTIKTVDLTNLSSPISSMGMAFYYCTALNEILGELDLSPAPNFTNTFPFCSNLVTITPKEKSINASISFSSCSKLSDLSIQSIVDGLADLTGDTAQTLTLHATVGAKLTDEQKATITAKNWTLVY